MQQGTKLHPTTLSPRGLAAMAEILGDAAFTGATGPTLGQGWAVEAVSVWVVTSGSLHLRVLYEIDSARQVVRYRVLVVHNEDW